MGWLTNPKKAWYNWFYYRSSISIPRLLGYKPSFGATMAALFVASMFNLVALPVDTVKAASKSRKIKKNIKENKRSVGMSSDSKRTELSRTETESKQTSSTITKSTLEKTAKNKTETAKVAKSPSATHSVSSANSKMDTNVKKRTTAQKSLPADKRSEIATNIDKKTFEPGLENLLKPVQPLPTPKSDKTSSKSIPKNKTDAYIQKKILLEDVLNDIGELIEGAYLDVEHDASANRVKLMYKGNPVGLLSEEDSFPIILCLRIGRKLYGVITDVKTDDQKTKIEIELWFSENN